MSDPETYGWDLLDSDMLQRMSIRKFVSMSREREFNLSATTPGIFLQSDNFTCPDFTKEVNLGLEVFMSLAGYVLTSPSAEPERSDYDSVFEARMPGIMSMAEVASKIDLGAWRLKFKSYTNVTLSVRNPNPSSPFFLIFCRSYIILLHSQRLRTDLWQYLGPGRLGRK